MSAPLSVYIPNVRTSEHSWIVKTMLTTYLGLTISVEQHELDTVLITNVEKTKVLELPSILLTANATAWDLTHAIPAHIPHWIEPAHLPWPMPEPDVNIPVLYASEDADLIEASESRIALKWDMFGSAFFMLSRLEEVLLPNIDAHGRFPATSSLAVIHGFERTPVVNAWGEILWGALQQLMPELTRSQHRYKTILSHDVDWPLVSYKLPIAQVIRAAAGDLLIRKAPLVAVRRLLSHHVPDRLKPTINPGNTFDFIMTESERYNLSSAFYFIPENTGGQIDGTYSLDMPFVQSLFREISERGHEIGIHPGYESFQSGKRISSGFEKLKAATKKSNVQQSIWGGRQHYLRWSSEETWQHWDDAGLSYDSSVGYADTVGFRTGACFDYPAFDVLNNQELKLRERPLIVMEGALFKTASRANLAARDSEGILILKQLADSTRAYDGNFTLLWHNSSLATRAEKSLYRRALAAVAQFES